MNQAFNWFENDIDAELEEFEQQEYKKSTFSSFFDFIANQVNFLLILLVGLRVIWFVFRIKCWTIFGVNFLVLLNSLIFVIGSFTIIVITIRILTYILLNIGLESEIENFLGTYRLITISIWCLLNLSWFKAIKDDILSGYYLIRALLTSILITSVVYNISSVFLILFDKYFVVQTLNSKISEVTRTEKILSIMKNFRYEISTGSTLGTPGCPCQDIFCYDLSSNSARDNYERRGLEEIDAKRSYLDIPEPQLHSVSDAKTLAKDVFIKASSDGLTLSFDEFSSIFPATQFAINAFTYFDNGIDKSITMKTFHDTILVFYMDRVNLEKSVCRAEEFVQIIGTFFNIIISVFLFIIYLIIFGAPLKELLAFALSSALALNFIASGMATELYYNFMMVLSHQFDIGDEVIVDNVEYKVYEVGMSNTSLVCENGGKVKFLNSELWKKTLINMTRAPEKILVFKFSLNPDISHSEFSELKSKIHAFLLEKKFDFANTFSLQSVSEENTGIETLECSLILKCKAFKNKTKKFYLRVETTNYLRRITQKFIK